MRFSRRRHSINKVYPTDDVDSGVLLRHVDRDEIAAHVETVPPSGRPASVGV